MHSRPSFPCNQKSRYKRCEAHPFVSYRRPRSLRFTTYTRLGHDYHSLRTLDNSPGIHPRRCFPRVIATSFDSRLRTCVACKVGKARPGFSSTNVAAETRSLQSYRHRSAHACLVPDHYLPVFLSQPRRWPTKRMPFRGRRLPTTSSSCTRNEHTTAAPTCIHASNRAKVTSFSTSHASLPASWTTHRHKNARNIPRN